MLLNFALSGLITMSNSRYIISEKQKSYTGKGFAEIIENKFSFHKDKDIQDYKTLIAYINALQVEQTEKIVKLLEANFGASQALL